MLDHLAKHGHVVMVSANVTKEIARQMMETTVPAEHQALGRKAKGFNREKWDEREPVSIALGGLC